MADHLSVPCPTCGVKDGEKCRRLDGCGAYPAAHVSRHRAAHDHALRLRVLSEVEEMLRAESAKQVGPRWIAFLEAADLVAGMRRK